jgi:hypothetical protein
MSKVTSLCLNNVYLTQLPDLSNMICLRWASFDNNCLTKIQVKIRLILFFKENPKRRFIFLGS